MSNAPSKPVSFSRPKVGYFSNRPRSWNKKKKLTARMQGFDSLKKKNHYFIIWTGEFIEKLKSSTRKQRLQMYSVMWHADFSKASLLSKRHAFPRCALKCNFIHAQKYITAFRKVGIRDIYGQRRYMQTFHMECTNTGQ